MAKGKGEVSAAEAVQFKVEFGDCAGRGDEENLRQTSFQKKKVRISDLPADTQVIGSRFVLTWKEVANKVAPSALSAA